MATLALDLYRSVRKEDFPDGVVVDDHAVTGVLYPAFEDKTYEVKVRGQTETRKRRADLYPKPFRGGQVVDPGGGTSLFDKSGAFGSRHWWYFKLPEGTVIPESLKIRHTGHNDVYNAEHYQIEVVARMKLEAFKGALDNLARNAVTKACEDVHG